MDVVARRAGICARLTDRATRCLQRKRALDRLGRLDARLDVQITDKIGVAGFEGGVGGVMELDAVEQLLAPAVRTYSVEHAGKLAAGFFKRQGLGR